MKSLLISLIALAACTAQAQQPCLKLKKVKIEKQLRQYDATLVRLTFAAKDCDILTDSLGKQTPTLDLDQAPAGITARLEAVEAHRVDQSTVGTGTLKAREISTIITLTSLAPSAVGDFTLFGTLHYNTVDSAGTIKPESLAFLFPFQVAPPKQQAEKNSFAEGLKKTGIVAAQIIVAPVLILFMLIYCPISGQCPDC
jgi:hypothetical protein